MTEKDLKNLRVNREDPHKKNVEMKDIPRRTIRRSPGITVEMYAFKQIMTMVTVDLTMTPLNVDLCSSHTSSLARQIIII